MSTTEMQGTPPTQPVDPELNLVLPGRGLPAGSAWGWIVEGWRLFVRAPLMWIVSIVVIFVIAIVVNFVPLIGTLAFQLFQGVFGAGFVVACRSLEKGGEFELEHLFAGFTKRLGPLLVVGALFLLGWIVIALVFMAFVGLSILSAFMTGDPTTQMAALAASAGSMIFGVLLMLALMVPLMAAYWFAPALVIMHDITPVAAMKESFFACFRNFIPFLLYGLVMTVAAFLAVLPFGLGLLVWVPVAIASTYVAYRQIFTEG
ncbi:MAG: hypothetical protein M3R58_18060 [Pseudomonadota bacterium]|nr:hypothetical protein [Pseudomonadota bacterium]